MRVFFILPEDTEIFRLCEDRKTIVSKTLRIYKKLSISGKATLFSAKALALIFKAHPY